MDVRSARESLLAMMIQMSRGTCARGRGGDAAAGDGVDECWRSRRARLRGMSTVTVTATTLVYSHDAGAPPPSSPRCVCVSGDGGG